MRRLLMLSLFAVGCVPTEYVRWNGRDGYSDWRLAPGRYHVEMQGNQHTPRNTVMGFYFRRASELCAGEGFDAYDTSPEVDGEVFTHSYGTATVVGRSVIASGGSRSRTAYVVSGDVYCIQTEPERTGAAPPPMLALPAKQ